MKKWLAGVMFFWAVAIMMAAIFFLGYDADGNEDSGTLAKAEDNGYLVREARSMPNGRTIITRCKSLDPAEAACDEIVIDAPMNLMLLHEGTTASFTCGHVNGMKVLEYNKTKTVPKVSKCIPSPFYPCPKH